MTCIRSILIAIVSVVLLSGCLESISYDREGEEQLVVYCVLTDTTSTQRLRLFTTSPSGIAAEMQSGAKVVVSSEKGTHVFHWVGGDMWEAEDFCPENNVKYDLTVLCEGNGLESSTVFPDAVRIKKQLVGFKVSEDDIGVHSTGVMLVCEDGKPYLKACNLWVISRSPKNQEEEAGYISGHEYTSRYLATTNEYADPFSSTSLKINDLQSFSNEAYSVLLGNLQRQMKSCYPPDLIYNTGPATYHYKIDYLLEWNAPRFSDVSLISRFYGLRPLYQSVLRISFPDNYDNSTHAPYIFPESNPHSFIVIGDYLVDDPLSLRWKSLFLDRFDVGMDAGRRRFDMQDIMVLEYSILSDEYDVFLKELYQRKFNEESGNAVEILYNKNNLPSNIIGGEGVFGCQSIIQYYE